MRSTLELQVNLKSRWHHGSMRIGVVAAELGVATHVLRHWEDERVVVPDRTRAGHRDYTEEHLRKLHIVQACQRVGLSLTEIRLILHRHEKGRDEVIDQHLKQIRSRRRELDATEAFLTHVLTCKHDLITRCENCSVYAAGQSTAKTPDTSTQDPPRTVHPNTGDGQTQGND
ncbi:MerR family transcriptional regulator [Nesterenkonia ebinurensis]|uniref:MerR family transcriptional regulator n=1 Tax=Nesterenkonia ebinurensis TaxID=2608252 RepID=UPI0037CC76BF